MLGKGIGYGKKVGEWVAQEQISQIFASVHDDKAQMFIDEMNQIPDVYIDIANQLAKRANEQLNITLTQSTYFALLDHLCFAVQRFHANMLFANKVYWEIKTYYPKEFTIGEYGIYLLNEQLNVHLPIDEAANIAFHFINAQTHSSHNGLRYAKLVGDIVNLTQYSLTIDLEEQGIHYTRFVTHVKFFVERYLDDMMLVSSDDTIFENVSKQYPKAMDLAYKVNEFVKKTFKKAMTNEELLYLAIHFNRLLSVQ